MRFGPAVRLLAIALLLVGFAGLLVYHGSSGPAFHHGAYDTADAEPDSPIVSVGPIDLTPPTHPLLRGGTYEPAILDQVYMYAVSIVGALWVLARLINGWRFDPERIALEPRDRPRYRLRPPLRRVRNTSRDRRLTTRWRRDR